MGKSSRSHRRSRGRNDLVRELQCTPPGLGRHSSCKRTTYSSKRVEEDSNSLHQRENRHGRGACNKVLSTSPSPQNEPGMPYFTADQRTDGLSRMTIFQFAYA